jgi:hypothetical protein
MVYGIPETADASFGDVAVLAYQDSGDIPHTKTLTSGEGRREITTKTAIRLLSEMDITLKPGAFFRTMGVSTIAHAVVYYLGVSITSCQYPADLRLKWLSPNDLKGEKGRVAAAKLEELCGQLEIPVEKLSVMMGNTLLTTILHLVIHKGSQQVFFANPTKGYEFPSHWLQPGQTLAEAADGIVRRLGGKLRAHAKPVHMENCDAIRLVNGEYREIKYAALDESLIKGALTGIYMPVDLVRVNYVNSRSMFANSQVDTGVVDNVIILGNQDIQARDDGSSISSSHSDSGSDSDSDSVRMAKMIIFEGGAADGDQIAVADESST